jgi:hypothetical protein
MANYNPYAEDITKYWGSLADAGQKQAAYNRPTTHGAFGSATVGADGSISSSFDGPFGQLNNSLMGQAASVAANPMDWGQFGTLGNGQDAGRQAAQAAYSQSTSRLNPFWEKSQNKLNTNLFQSGMGDSSAADSAQGEFGRARNDAYTGAMTDALGAGMQAQQQAFGGNLAARQNSVANALRGQTQPFEDLAGMQGFMAQPEVGQDNSMLEAQAAENRTAQTKVFSDKERELTDTMAKRGTFTDKPGERPGAGARRQKWFESLPQEQRIEVIAGLRYMGEME